MHCKNRREHVVIANAIQNFGTCCFPNYENYQEPFYTGEKAILDRDTEREWGNLSDYFPIYKTK